MAAYISLSKNQEKSFKTCILIKKQALKEDLIKEHYLKPNINHGSVIAVEAPYTEKNTAPATFVREKLSKLLPNLDKLGVQIIYVADSTYFKYLTGVRKTDPYIGNYLPCSIKGYEHISIVLGVNYQALYYNPLLKEKLSQTLVALEAASDSLPVDTSSIDNADITYVNGNDVEAVTEAFKKLLDAPHLAVDVETFSLKFQKSGLGSIAFAWSEQNSIAFSVEHHDNQRVNCDIFRPLLLKFFQEYQGTVIYHGSTFDIKILVNWLFLNENPNTRAMLDGIKLLTSKFHDTYLIAYLALNNTIEKSYRLKSLAHEFIPNYALDSEDINDITRVATKDLLEYNAIDTLATFYVFNKYYKKLKEENLVNLYEELFIKSVPIIIQMELTGMPIDMGNVKDAKNQLLAIKENLLSSIRTNPYIIKYVGFLRFKEYTTKNAGWKTKSEPLEYFDYVQFNPNSDVQKSDFLYSFLGLPVLETTKSKNPSTKNKTLKKLINHTDDTIIKNLLQNFIDLNDVSIILDNFISSFIKNSFIKTGQYYFLYGSYKLGGTKSGRLSSSDPNLQNIPSSGTVYAKIIKQCFKPPKGWIFAGADFASLEDRISALTTKDPNKIKVYTDGFDGHCLRAYYYFKEQMEGIEETVESINSIEDSYPQLRQDSKPATFALTYQGTYITLMNNLGWSEEKAKAVEKAYHDLYAVSDQWVQDRIKRAHDVGYIEAAFGLRLRTPMLHQTIYGSDRLPYEAQQEQRTAGNALGQSWGLLNNRAAIELRERLQDSPFEEKILPICHVHDSQYFLVREDMEALKWLNDNLIECMEWQDHPDIAHPDVKLGGNLSVFIPDWSKEIKIPNKVSLEEITKIYKENL